MPWSGEVICHAVVLSSPLAACCAARLLSRLAKELEGSRSGYTVLRRASLCVHKRAGDAGEAKYFLARAESDCFQYNNAAFCHQSVAGCCTDTANCDEEDLDFCIITPQQALGALGDHAPHFTKIFLNGLTFVEDSSEPGTVLSVDECADRMQSAVSHSRSTESLTEPSSPCLSPTAEQRLDESASCHTDCGASSSHMSCRSISSSMTLFSSSDPADSHRSSFDIVCSSSRLYGEQLFPEDSTEQPFATLSDMGCSSPARVDAPFLDHAPIWYGGMEAPSAGSWQACGGLGTPFGLAAAVQLACDMHHSDSADCDSTRKHIDGQVAAVSRHEGHLALKMHHVNSAGLVEAAATRPLGCESVDLEHRPARAGAAHPRVNSPVTNATAPKRRWISSSARGAPPPLPPPVSRPAAVSFVSRASSSSFPQGAIVEDRWDARPVSYSPQPPHPRRCSQAAAAAVAPTGLCRAPALPLPDGATLESCVPPALRYYLAQARAAGVTGVDVGSAYGPTGGVDCEHGVGQLEEPAACAECAAGRPGFVKATVEQLNTQRLVCCHVTPFAAANTSRKPRPLTQRGGR